MKERNLFYFVTAVITTMIFLISLIIRFFPWFNSYGYIASPTTHYVLIPFIIIWVGWYFENKGFLLGSVVILSVILFLHLDQVGILSGKIFAPNQYLPIIKTSFLLQSLLLVSQVAFGFFTYLKIDLELKKS